MKDKQAFAQGLCENLDRVDESLLQQAFETDTAEKFHALDGKTKKIHIAKDRPVTTFQRVASIAACLAVALTIAFGGIALAKHLSGTWGPIPTDPPPMTQPPGTTQIAPTDGMDPKVPPRVYISHTQVNTQLSLLSYKWTYNDGDNQVTANAYAAHPLQATTIPQLTYESMPATILFEAVPQKITVRCWDAKYQGNDDGYDLYEVISTSETLRGHLEIALKPGSYIYEVAAEWNDVHGSYGSASYVFAATVNNDGPASRDVTISSGETSISTQHEFFCYGTYCTGDGKITADGIGARHSLNLSSDETDISTIPILPLDQEISIQLAEHGTLQWVEVFSQNADGEFVLLEDFAGTVEALSELPLGTWFVALNIEWKDTCIHDDSEERCYDHLFILEVSRQAEISNPHGTCGENATWEFDPATGTLTISGSGDMKDYSTSAPWGAYRDWITQVIIEDGITAIGGFYGCENLTVVRIPDSVTTLHQYAFSNCSSIKTIKLPDSITSVGQSVFHSCTSLEQINIPSALTTIRHGMLSGCRSLRSISLHAGITEIHTYAFKGCASLESIILPNSVTYLAEQAFTDCVNLRSVTLSENIADIPYFAFDGCTSLKEVTLPESVTTVGNYAFRNCTNLQTIILGSKVESISVYAFQGCSQLQGFQISEDNPYLTAEPIGAIFNKDMTELVLMAPGYTDVYDVPEGVVSIRGWSFYNCTLSGVILPNSVTSIGESAFDRCSNLESVILSENLKEIESSAFAYCRALLEITFPVTVEKVGAFAFNECVNLRFAKFLGPCPEFGNLVFNDVTGKLYYPPFDTEWFILSPAIAVDMEWLPYICSDGHTVQIHPAKDVTCTEDGITEGKSCTVCGECILGQKVIPAKGHFYSYWEKVPEMPNLYRRVCQYCSDIIEQIEDISQYPPDSGTCGDSLTWHYADGVLTITGTGPMPNRFSGNAPWYKYWGVITTVVLPEGLTHITEYAFRGLLNLQTIIIPSSVTSLGYKVFLNCSGLSEIHFLGDMPQMAYTFASNTNVTIYYPADNDTWTQEAIDKLIAFYGSQLQFVAVDENGQPVNP